MRFEKRSQWDIWSAEKEYGEVHEFINISADSKPKTRVSDQRISNLYFSYCMNYYNVNKSIFIFSLAPNPL